MEDKKVYRETFLFPIDAKSIIEGEKNKVIKIFLNQLDIQLKDEEVKRQLRQVFLDSINGFARLTKGLIKQYSQQAGTFERLIHVIEDQKNV